MAGDTLYPDPDALARLLDTGPQPTLTRVHGVTRLSSTNGETVFLRCPVPLLRWWILVCVDPHTKRTEDTTRKGILESMSLTDPLCECSKGRRKHLLRCQWGGGDAAAPPRPRAFGGQNADRALLVVGSLLTLFHLSHFLLIWSMMSSVLHQLDLDVCRVMQPIFGGDWLKRLQALVTTFPLMCYRL